MEGVADAACFVPMLLGGGCGYEDFRRFPPVPFTVGFDRLFDMLAEGVRPDWPPYDIEKKGENEYAITMAVAGFAPDEIELTQHGTQLLVTGQRKGAQGDGQVLHQGIAARAFKQTFNLAEHVRVASANLKNGLLSVELVREVPELGQSDRRDARHAEAPPGDGEALMLRFGRICVSAARGAGSTLLSLGTKAHFRPRIRELRSARNYLGTGGGRV